MAHYPLTENETAVRDMIATGVVDAVVAKYFGVDPSAVGLFRRKRGIPSNSRAGRKLGVHNKLKVVLPIDFCARAKSELKAAEAALVQTQEAHARAENVVKALSAAISAYDAAVAA
jgi:hypothetical protein